MLSHIFNILRRSPVLWAIVALAKKYILVSPKGLGSYKNYNIIQSPTEGKPMQPYLLCRCLSNLAQPIGVFAYLLTQALSASAATSTCELYGGGLIVAG